MKYLKTILLIILCGILKAGNNPVIEAAKNDFKKMNAKYATAKGISMETYYTVFADYYSQSMIEGKNGMYIKYNNDQYVRIDNIETYNIGDKIISINQGNRQIMVGDNQPKEELLPIQQDMDTLLALCTNIKVEQINPDEKKYKLFFDERGSEYSCIDVQINTKTCQYVKLTLYYSNKVNLVQDFYAEEKAPRLEIKYKNLKFLETVPSIFSQDLYVLNVNGKLKPAPKYYNYKISDLRNQTRIKTKNN